MLLIPSPTDICLFRLRRMLVRRYSYACLLDHPSSKPTEANASWLTLSPPPPSSDCSGVCIWLRGEHSGEQRARTACAVILQACSCLRASCGASHCFRWAGGGALTCYLLILNACEGRAVRVDVCMHVVPKEVTAAQENQPEDDHSDLIGIPLGGLCDRVHWLILRHGAHEILSHFAALLILGRLGDLRDILLLLLVLLTGPLVPDVLAEFLGYPLDLLFVQPLLLVHGCGNARPPIRSKLLTFAVELSCKTQRPGCRHFQTTWPGSTSRILIPLKR
mmetsp:Transcript_14400/g.30824  ORF Transcript_14400/g.30824 Transcript_14400/m.30824 type:complete len:277 (+) Transcript_14400:165-995(+)